MEKIGLIYPTAQVRLLHAAKGRGLFDSLCQPPVSIQRRAMNGEFVVSQILLTVGLFIVLLPAPPEWKENVARLGVGCLMLGVGACGFALGIVNAIRGR